MAACQIRPKWNHGRPVIAIKKVRVLMLADHRFLRRAIVHLQAPFLKYGVNHLFQVGISSLDGLGKAPSWMWYGAWVFQFDVCDQELNDERVNG